MCEAGSPAQGDSRKKPKECAINYHHEERTVTRAPVPLNVKWRPPLYARVYDKRGHDRIRHSYSNGDNRGQSQSPNLCFLLHIAILCVCVYVCPNRPVRIPVT